MKTFIRLTLISAISAFIFLCGESFAQSPSESLALAGQRIPLDSLKKNRPDFYRKSLVLDSARSVQVAGIQDAYKAALRVIVQDSSLTLDARRERMRALMMERNQTLRGILNLEQQQKVIPTTEQANPL